jgi:hypothetical protein
LEPAEPDDLASGAAADFAHAATEPPPQLHAQSHAFGVPGFGGDLIDAGLAGF